VSTEALATEATKNSIENSVNWFLSDKLQDPAVTIATKKFATNDNLLIYLTHCNVAETSVPRIKVQVFERIDRGVRETGYQIFADHRFVKFVNNMMFGTKPGVQPPNPEQAEVTEEDAAQLLNLVNSLTQARQT
jgi:hypothetical protein